MRMCHFWAQNGPFTQIRIFFRKPVNEPCFIHSCLSTCQKSKSDINLLVKYWLNLISWEPFLPSTWELDFSQACSLHKMLMNHKNLDFTKISDKTNDLIFLKRPKTMFWAIFDDFFPDGDFFQKIRLSHTTIYGPLTLC